MTVTADSTTEPTLVRDRLPEGWTVVDGDAHSVRELEGATYVEFDDPLESGESRRYYVAVAEDTGEYEYGPLEYSAAGELWATASDTTESAVVVGLDTS